MAPTDTDTLAFLAELSAMGVEEYKDERFSVRFSDDARRLSMLKTVAPDLDEVKPEDDEMPGRPRKSWRGIPYEDLYPSQGA